MNRFCLLLLSVWSLFSVGCVNRDSYMLASPDRGIHMDVFLTDAGMWNYSVTAGDSLLLSGSSLSFKDSVGQELLTSERVRLTSASTDTHNGVWKPVWGKRSSVEDCFQELSLDFSAVDDTKAVIRLVCRAYNDGVAFRYMVPEGSSFHVKDATEGTCFAFNGDYTAWFYNNEWHNIGPELLSESDGIRQPVMTVRVNSDLYMAVHEADLRTDAPLLLHSAKGELSFRVASQAVDLVSGYMSAWRVIFVGRTPGQMVDSHLLELLNPDPLEDFSWVKPGVAVWDWRINGAEWENFTYGMDYPSWVRMVDFAAKNHLSYLVLDANWYGPEHEEESNPLVGDKAADVKRIIHTAKKRELESGSI